MSPAASKGEIPPFHKLGEYLFEKLCRDLLFEEPNIATSDLYGVRGQKQDGIDVIAYRTEGDGIEVGQCKCYANFLPAKIRQVSEEFFQNWENNWSKKNVKRFILFVACEMNTRQRLQEIDKQRERFAEVGVNYEAWSGATIQNKLRPHPSIVATYFEHSDNWIKTICGSLSSSSSWANENPKQTTAILDSALLSRSNQLAAHISNETQKKLDSMWVAFQEGHKNEVVDKIKELKSEIIWTSLEKNIKANVLCFEANLALYEPDGLNDAKQLLDESKQLAHLDSQTKVESFIFSMEGELDQAIQQLEDKKDLDSINLKATFWLNMGKIEKSQALLENANLESNAETFRIRALSYFLSQNLSQARLEIQKALELEPNWYSVLFVEATINYFSALSPAAFPKQMMLCPEPVNWSLVKRDFTSFTYLRKAEQTFHELLKNNEIEGRQTYLETWRLACLANDSEKQQDALEYCKTLLQANPSHYLAIHWANERNFEVNLNPSKKALKTLVAQNKATTFHILALINCYIGSKKTKKAINLLKETKDVFEQEQTVNLWHLSHIQLLVFNGKPELALKTIDSSPLKTELFRDVRSLVLGAIAKKQNNWQPLVQHLEKSYEETHDPIFLIQCCDLMAQQQKWDYIAAHAQQLIDEIGTSEALRLAIIGTYNVNNYAKCLEYLDEYQGFFKQLPTELRQLKIDCQSLQGILLKAVTDAEKLASDEPTTQNLVNLTKVYFNKGDLKSLAIVARQFINRSDLSTRQLLEITHWVRLEDQQLAKSLWTRAIKEIADENVIAAYSLGLELGFKAELKTLTMRMVLLTNEERYGIQILTFDETKLWIKQQGEQQAKLFDFYHNGNIYIHIILEKANQPLVNFYHDILQENETKPNPITQFALFARHGGRILIDGFPKNIPIWRLNLDITAVLLAAHLDILSEVEKVFKPLRIPAELIPDLQAELILVLQKTETQNWLKNLINQLRQGIDNGTYEILPASSNLKASKSDILNSLKNLKNTENDVLWIDDRYINGYSIAVGNIPIIGINEILKALVTAKSLTIKQYYAKIIQLRAANVRYIPIEKDEILYYLRQAKIENHEILETPELSIIRRYIAACLLQGDKLQLPPMPENSSNQNGEVAFLLSFEKTISAVLIELWANKKDENSHKIRAEWLITNLYIDWLGISKLTSRQKINNQNELYLFALSLSRLFFAAISLPPSLNTEIPIRRQYLNWVFNRILQKQFKANNNFLITFVELFKNSVLSTSPDTKEIEDKEIETLLIKAFYNDLPKPIQIEIERDSNFMAKIGIKIINTISVEDFSFKSADFFHAAKTAINGQKATIKTVENNPAITFQPLDGHFGQQIFYNNPITGDKKIIEDIRLEILIDSPAKREAVLQKNRYWFDCSDETFKQAVADIASIEDLQQRLKENDKWINSSATIYYSELEQKMKNQGNFQFSELLPPSVEGLFRHFRIMPEIAKTAKFSYISATLAKQLLKEEKLITTMERIMALPVPLPIILKDAIAKLSLKEKRAIVKKSLNTNSAPLAKIHFIHLLFSEKSKAYKRLARKIIKNLFSEQGIQEIESFLVLLRWINEKFNHWLRDYSPSIRLAMVWANAHRLFSIFMSLNLPSDWIQQTFNQTTQQPELFKREFEYHFDIAHPECVSQITFLFAGIVYSIGDNSIDETLEKVFIKAAFIENELLPNPLLLRDTTEACNGLGSFFCGDFGEKFALLLGTENVKTFTPSIIKSAIKKALNKLAKNTDDLTTWLQLYLMFGNMPANNFFVDRLKAILFKTDFTKLLEQDMSNGTLLMHMVSLQIGHFQDENLRLYLKEQFLKIVKIIKTKEVDEALLIESAFKISIAKQPADKAVAEFVELVTQLIETCNSLIPMYKPIIQHFCEELPVSQAQQFWPLLIRLRTF